MSLVAGRERSLGRGAAVPRALVDLCGYAAASAVALGIDYGLLLGLVAAGLNYLVAAAISFCAGMGACYWLSVRYVFADCRPSSQRIEAALFFAVGMAGLALTQVLLFAFVSCGHLPVALAKIPTAGLVFAFNFVGRRSLVFFAPKTSCPEDAVPGPGTALFRRLANLSLTDVSVGVALALVWGLGHTYLGIEGDGRIYMGRVLADLDPAGAGRDLIFLLDGQSKFTLYSAFAAGLIRGIGFAPGVVGLALLNIVVWFVAIVVFVRTIAPGRPLMIVLAAVVALPRFYGPWGIFGAAETMAIPRPLAEAGVIFAFAALSRERYLLAAACLFGAALFHPIMAAPGLCVLLILLGRRDRRWFLAAALAVAGLVIVAASGLPVASRLLVTMDAAWRATLTERTPYLFVGLWPIQSYATPLVQITTILIGASFLEPRFRIIFTSVVAVGLFGSGLSFVFCDLLGDVLFAQAQVWRWLWPIGALAPVAAGVCLWRLPERGPAGHLVLVALCVGWLSTVPAIAAVAAVAAAAAAIARPVFRPALVPFLWSVVGLVAVSNLWSDLSIVEMYDGPPGLPVFWAVVWSIGLPTVPLLVLAFAAWRRPDARATLIAAPVFAAAAFVLLTLVWDARTPRRADADTAVLKPDLTALLNKRPGAVLWLGGEEIWYWAHRPNWVSAVQGAALVFSRDLALSWHDRADQLVRFGLATRNFLNPWETNVAALPLTLDREKVLGFCRLSDAPAWIVAPLNDGGSMPSGLGATIWQAPGKKWDGFLKYDVNRRSSSSYLIVPCAPSP